MPDVFVVGAGFSKAALGSMPTLADLGRDVGQRLLASPVYSVMLGDRVRGVLRAGGVPMGDVEAWLSALAQPQPFMSQSEGTRNLAIFQEMRNQIVEVIDSAQGKSVEPPQWLRRLLRLWHRRQVSVLSFNYDTLIESSVGAIDPPHEPGDIVAGILSQLPRPALTFWYGGENQVPTFRLYKLHGSVDWYWNPADQSGDSLCRDTPGGIETDRRPALAGKEPFIIPPLSVKSPFYSLGLIRQLWKDAGEALAAASRVVVLGYSVPLTDLATTAMLSQTANAAAEWHVVDATPDPVQMRLVRLGVPKESIVTYSALEDFVDTYESDHCHTMTADLADQLARFGTADRPTVPVMIRSSRSVPPDGIVSAIHKEGAEFILEAHAIDPRTPFPEFYPRGPALLGALRQVNPPTAVSVRWRGITGEHRVLGALDPNSARGVAAVLDWCPIEAQDTRTVAQAV
jgi:hypothetical protein